jgi:hypothetical protein
MPKPKSWVLKIEEPGSNLDSKEVRKQLSVLKPGSARSSLESQELDNTG